MQALVLSDIHGQLEMLGAIKELLHNRIRLVLLLGDLTQMGGAKQAGKVLEALSAPKVLGLAGNFELPAVQQELERQDSSLHGKKERVGKWVLVGFGGGKLGDPGRNLFSEKEIGESLGKLLAGEENVVLLTHLPPYGTKLDLTHSGMHIGSRAVRQAIEEFKPVLHLCGHCHEGIGEEKVGETVSVNVGAVKDGNAVLLELGEELKWKKVRL